jgi:hypothetical protein
MMERWNDGRVGGRKPEEWNSGRMGVKIKCKMQSAK